MARMARYLLDAALFVDAFYSEEINTSVGPLSTAIFNVLVI